MHPHSSKSTNQVASVRAKQIKATIGKLKRQVQKILASGEVAPPHCHVIRYQTKQNQKIYWYYKLQATEPIFPTATDRQKKSKYLYLGKAGSEAHLEAVEQVIRRGLIDELERAIESLQSSYLDVCFGGEIEPDPSDSNAGFKSE